jgi:hypothetical protein
MPDAAGFHCRQCGEYHAELAMSFGAEAPAFYDMLPPEEREQRADCCSDLCVIDDRWYFVRGCLEIPVLDGDGPFIWGVWASVSETSFKRIIQVLETPGREAEPPYFGWLSTALPGYPQTLKLKTHVHTMPIGVRPRIELEPTDHPLAVEQREGITMARVREINELLLHEGN